MASSAHVTVVHNDESDLLRKNQTSPKKSVALAFKLQLMALFLVCFK